MSLELLTHYLRSCGMLLLGKVNDVMKLESSCEQGIRREVKRVCDSVLILKH